jgi:hypothetical protein
VIQAAWNLRDVFKIDRRTLVLLGPAIDLPPELAGDVVVFDEPLPDAEAAVGIVREQFTKPRPEARRGEGPQARDRGRPGPAGVPGRAGRRDEPDQGGLDVPALWERKRRQIELTPGLKVHREAVRSPTSAAWRRSRASSAASSPARPGRTPSSSSTRSRSSSPAPRARASDSSGVSQDQLGTLLAYMQDQGAAGCIFVGPPGAAKSMVAKAAGNEAGIPTIQLDLGAMKGSLVGQSEQNLRAALKVITSVSNGGACGSPRATRSATCPPSSAGGSRWGRSSSTCPTPRSAEADLGDLAGEVRPRKAMGRAARHAAAPPTTAGPAPRSASAATSPGGSAAS